MKCFVYVGLVFLAGICKIALKISGTTCAVRGCTYNQTKLNLWLKEQCYIHNPKVRAEYLNLKKPPKTLYVCSFHFVEKTTEDNPYPTHSHPPLPPLFFLGYEKSPEKRCRLWDDSSFSTGKFIHQALHKFQRMTGKHD